MYQIFVETLENKNYGILGLIFVVVLIKYPTFSGKFPK